MKPKKPKKDMNLIVCVCGGGGVSTVEQDLPALT